MESMIAYCGIECSACPAFTATSKNDVQEMEKVAKLWSKRFGITVSKEHVKCFGCKIEGKPISYYCENVCKIRLCARGKSIDSCASCPDYACKMLSDFLIHAVSARKNLEKLRENRQDL